MLAALTQRVRYSPQVTQPAVGAAHALEAAATWPPSASEPTAQPHAASVGAALHPWAARCQVADCSSPQAAMRGYNLRCRCGEACARGTIAR
jgi:hypothetical protein